MRTLDGLLPLLALILVKSVDVPDHSVNYKFLVRSKIKLTQLRHLMVISEPSMVFDFGPANGAILFAILF